MNQPIPFGWYAVAYSKDLAAKDVKPLFFFDQHLVLFRTESGQAQLLEPYCPHLGAHLGHGGKVSGESIVCPFHAWQLNVKGEVTDIPYANKMPPRAKEGACLHSFPTQERNQMIWSWYHPQNLPPLFNIEDIPEFADPDWSELNTYEWEINANLQETGENAVDIAHFVYVHQAATMPKAKITLDGALRVTDMITISPAIDDEGNIDMERTQDMHLVSKNYGPGMALQEFTQAFKTVMMASMVPITQDKMLLRFAFTKPTNISEQSNMLTDVLIAEIVNQVKHDIPIWQNKIYREAPILCDGDGPIAKYRTWFKQFYAEEEVAVESMTQISSG